MKFKALLSALLITGIAVIYTACKKSENAPATGPALTERDVTSQVALELTQNLFGGYGGINLYDGLSAPSEFAEKHLRGPVLHDLANPFCGLVVDTTLNDSVTPGADTTISVSGHIKFGFSCTNDNITGFNLNEDLNIAVSTPILALVSKVQQNLNLTAINPDDENSQLSLSGTLSTSGNYKYNDGSNKSGTRSFNFVLTSLVLDAGGEGDIVSGSATFSTKGTGANGSWSYSGTITFLGNHEAKITINNKTYNVDLKTGAII
ncbi:MAG TPA: hypothetical protein VHA56_21530 [Mucilaginibacter sp.]|nr:hypothetical protein [Mucilaginibacter sp.]